MRRKIPSTTALVSFEAAARHESFTKAAHELSLTQGAVCRQIGGLEEFLGVELFRRSRRGVKLTEAGLSYSRRVAQQLDAVERDTLSVMGQQGANAIELAELPLLQQTTRPYAWRQWFNAQGMDVARDMTGPRYELFSMLAQAAMHDMGVALIPPFLIQRELHEKRLVIANACSLSGSKAYHLIIPERKVESASLSAFRDWLVAQARNYQLPQEQI
ncbi:LysR family transcriptional regulator [Pseudomonas sp. ST1]|uniref:HTH lysR-type domain-containing protein n=1 Tax=Pseudomonas savastanoi pv. nerii TaxID=360921 RepID=A0AB74BRS7_PSESS|nr:MULTISPECIES: LysR family transcriptional regulator [Pseudomonas]KPB19230.1 transcriptional regulator [Pseudomonas savastanoi]RMT82701.1 hypothetical protein ALP42_200060 [Pseudomonas savastanoi pv. nerii]TSC32530.1 LysR family transcriptional regulator [Pseudomonas sp. ST1]